MDFHKALADVTRSVLFKDWHAKNPDYFLAHGFLMLDDANKDTWQIGFYNPTTERMITFVLENGRVTHTPEQETLRSDAQLLKLDPADVVLPVEDALSKNKDIIAEHYSAEKPVKQFFIIQHLEGHTVFNITSLTQGFKTINVKIDAKTGDVVKHSIQALAEFT